MGRRFESCSAHHLESTTYRLYAKDKTLTRCAYGAPCRPGNCADYRVQPNFLYSGGDWETHVRIVRLVFCAVLLATNWLYTRFAKATSPDYHVVHSATRDNVFLPADFVQTLEEAYTANWREQELEGRFVELEGALFQRSWFQTIETAPPNLKWFRYWDLAASTRTTADYTASAAVALGDDGAIYCRDMIRGRFEWPDAKRIIMQTMLTEPSTEHGIEEALHGLAAIQELRREPSIANITLRGIRVDKDKVSRALPWAARAEAGKVKLIRGNWIAEFLDEACSFPHGRHDDMIDSLSGGIQMITKPKRQIMWAITGEDGVHISGEKRMRF